MFFAALFSLAPSSLAKALPKFPIHCEVHTNCAHSCWIIRTPVRPAVAAGSPVTGTGGKKKQTHFIRIQDDNKSHAGSLWNLSFSAMRCVSELVKICRFCSTPLALGELYEAEMQIISVGTGDAQYACAQQGSGRVRCVPSLLHWAESNLPFFEYLLWECCCCLPRPSSTTTNTYTERWVHLWLAATMSEPRLKSPSSEPTCWHGFPDCPVVIDTSLC